MKAWVNLRLFTIAAAVAFVHLTTGLTIWLGHATYALATTPLALISTILDNNTTTVGVMLVVAAIMALIPFFSKNPIRSRLVALILPQQTLLILHFFSIITALIAGHYPDGYVPNGGTIFIFVDQIWLLTIVFWHSMEYWTTLTWSGDKKSELKHDEVV